MQILNYLTITLLLCFCCISFLVLIVAAFSPLSSKIGFRNINRRLGNTILVVIGCLVGTSLISGSLVIGDSLNKSVEKIVIENLGETDVTIDTTRFGEKDLGISETHYKNIRKLLNENIDHDGIYSSTDIFLNVTKVNAEGQNILKENSVKIKGIDVSEVNTFGRDNPTYEKFNSANSAFVSQALAVRLELNEGDTIKITYNDKDINLKVQKIYPNDGIIEYIGVLIDKKAFSNLLDLNGTQTSMIFISAPGGPIPEDYDSGLFVTQINSILADYANQKDLFLVAQEQKNTFLNGGQIAIAVFISMFLGLSTFGIFAGILLIINLYSMLAEERKMEMGIMRAIGFRRIQLSKMFVFEGFVYSIASSILGAFMGIFVGFVLVTFLSQILNNIFSSSSLFAGIESPIVFGFQIRSLLIAFSVGLIITFLSTIISSYRISKINIVSAIRLTDDVVEKKLNLRFFISLFINLGAIGIGAIFILLALISKQLFDNPKYTQDTVNVFKSYTLYIGLLMFVLFVGKLIVLLVKYIINKDINRFIFTIVYGFLTLFTLSITKIDFFKESIETSEGFSLVFLTSMVLVVSVTLIVSYNLKILTTIISYIASFIPYLRSTVKIALAYPTENRQSLSLTLIMFSLIIFLVAYIGMFKATLLNILDKTISGATGGYEVIVDLGTGTSEINDLKQKITKIEGVDNVLTVEDTLVTVETKSGANFYVQYTALPTDYLNDENVDLAEISPKYSSEKDVLKAVNNDSSKIILGNYIAFSAVEELNVGDKITIFDTNLNKVSEKEIIGKLDLSSSEEFNQNVFGGMITTDKFFRNDFDSEYLIANSTASILINYESGDTDANKILVEIKKVLVNYEDATIMPINDLIGSILSFISGFISMLQGFLAFSLVVGVSSLAIIVTKGVHERKQQIGMLRSLGFQRHMILFSFFVETSFITLLGIVIGIGTGLISAFTQLQIALKEVEGFDPVFPYKEVLIISTIVYISSVIFATLPALRAAKLSPVEATNYPE